MADDPRYHLLARRLLAEEAAASVALDAGSRDHTGIHTCDGRCAEKGDDDGR